METEVIFVIVIGLLILISAFFSGSETALMSSSKPKLHSLEKDHESATLVNKLLKDPAKLLSTILLGNNLVNIAASSIATVLFTEFFGATGVLYATLIMTVVVLIFAEVLPKTIASLYPEDISMKIVKVMSGISFVLSPFTKTINCITHFIMRICKIQTSGLDSFFDENDIKGAISLGLKTGVLERGEHRMLGSIVELDSISAEEIMQHRSTIESINIDSDMNDIFAIIKNSSYSRIPVYKDNVNNIIGILYVKDFWPQYAESIKNNEPFNINTIMKEASFVPESALISDLLIDFRKTRSHMRFVVDEYGDLQGLVTLEDILEEIVGEIEDEHDRLQRKVIHLDDSSLIISGFYAIRDCNRDFDWDLPDDDHITLGGFVASLAEQLPQIGDIVEFNNLEFRVLTKKKQALLKLKVTQKSDSSIENPNTQEKD